MGKEFKIGVAVIGTVAVAFGAILYQRVNKLKTTQAVAENQPSTEQEAPKPDKLFVATNQLDTASAADAGSGDDAGFRWNATPDEEPATEQAAVESAPPRASFLPTDVPATEDRYGSRYADADTATPATDTVAEEAPRETAPLAATPADQNPIGRIVADASDAARLAEPSSPDSTAAAPSAGSNPFARTLPATTEPSVADPISTDPVAVAPMPAEPMSEPAAAPLQTEPRVSEVAASNINQPRSIAIVQPQEQEQALPPEPAEIPFAAEAAAPARLDTRAVPTAAISEAPRPASRFITPEEVTPQADAGSRYSDSLAQPTPRAATPPVAGPAVGGTHRLGPNENFWSVSERAYGTGGYFKALHAYNAAQHPIADDLAVGDEIRVPERAELERQFPNLCPKPGRRSTRDSYAIQASAKLNANGETYVVQEGDTLFDIARYELGKAARWAELYELNREAIGTDIDFLRPGMELILPSEDARADSVTRQPGGALR